MFGAQDANSMFRPPSLMNLVRDPNDPTKAKIVWNAPQQPQGQPTTSSNPFTMTGPVSTPSTATPTPAPLSSPQPDWTKLIGDLVTALTTPKAPDPVTVTPPVTVPDTSPTNTTQEPKLPNTNVESIDVNPGDLPPLTPANTTVTPPNSKPEGKEQQGDAVGIELPYIPPIGVTAPGSLPDAPFSPLPSVGTVTTIEDPSKATPAIGGGNVTAGMQPPSNSILTGGPAVVPADFGTSAAEKTGSSGGLNTNDLVNGLINAGGLVAPPGVGSLASLLKSGIEAYNGDTFNTNGLTGAESLAYGPGLGGKVGSYLGSLLGGPTQLPMSAANDPAAQIGNQTANGGLTNGMFSGPASVPDVAGNAVGAGSLGGFTNPSMAYSTNQLGNIDLSGLTNFIQSGKMPNGLTLSDNLSNIGTGIFGGAIDMSNPWGKGMFVDVGPMSMLQQMNLGT